MAVTVAGCAESPTSDPQPGTSAASATSPSVRLQPSDVEYLGAFRLPGGEERPSSFAYGGSAMTVDPGGDPNGPADGFAGSLFVSGHDRLPYGELPNGGQVAEVSIPAPRIGTQPSALPEATFLQPFHDAVGNLFPGLDEIPRLGFLFLDHSATGPRIHVAWGQHLQDPRPSHGLFGSRLSSPSPHGPWSIAGASAYSVNGYMAEIPGAWAAAYVGGRVVGTGRYKDGGWSGKGPALFAYAPWDAGGTLRPSGAQIEARPLLLYESSETNADVRHQAMSGYQHPDEWEGAAWVTSASGRSAVLFVGTKSRGTKFWYGWAHPGGADRPCVETEFVNQFTTCWTAQGAPCPSSDLGGCSGHNDYRGWWSGRFSATILFYDPGDLARVASGAASAHEPQPYAELEFDGRLFHNPDGVEEDMLGRGSQRRYRIGESAYDRRSNRLYVLELFADGTKPVVHVFSLGS